MLVELGEETVVRLKRHAEPLVDNFDSVIARLLDSYETKVGRPSQETSVPDAKSRDFSAKSPPDLKHTKVLSVLLDGEWLPKPKATWNGLLAECVKRAVASVSDPGDIRSLITINYTAGKKEDEGYRYLPDTGVSIQGQDANAAWGATRHILLSLTLSAEVTFVWRNKNDAAFPGQVGRFILQNVDRSLQAVDSRKAPG